MTYFSLKNLEWQILSILEVIIACERQIRYSLHHQIKYCIVFHSCYTWKVHKEYDMFFLFIPRTALRNIVSFYFNQHLISEQVC